jgi:hypothetical protein
MIPGLILGLLLQLSPASAHDTATIARVGGQRITVGDLQENFEFGPAFPRRGRDPFRRYLKYMTYEMLIAQEAKRHRLDTTLFVRERVRALEEDLAVDELYKREILQKVNLSEGEIDTAVQMARWNIRLRWIYRREEDRAKEVERHLRSGASFDSLFLVSTDSMDVPGERRLETTLLKLQRDSPTFADRIKGLRVLEVSDVFPGPDGFYIVRIDQLWQNPLQTESESAATREEAAVLMKSVKADALAGGYVKQIMLAANPVIKADGFNILLAYIAEKGLSRETKLTWEIPATFMTEAGPMPIGTSGRSLKKTLATYGSGSLTVRDYTRWYDIRQFQFNTRSLAAFNSSVKRSVWKMVQDRLLSKEAYERGFNHFPTVSHDTEKWSTKLLYLAGRASALKSVSVSDSALRAEYERVKGRFVDARGDTKSFDDVAGGLRITMLRAEEDRVLFRLLQRLQRETPVSINEPLLDDLARNVPAERGAIDVVVYKPGGTFPRVAVPTIDLRWQSFP